MAAFQKLGDYTNGTVNDGTEVTAEYNNIYEAFNGTSSDKEMERKLNHATKAPMINNQTGAGKLAQFQLSGTDKVTIENSGETRWGKVSGNFLRMTETGTGKIWIVAINGSGHLVIGEEGVSNAITIDHTTGLVTFEEQPVFPDNEITITKTWLYTVLPSAIEAVESQPRFIVPSIGQNKITKIYSTWAAGADSGASNIFTIKRRNAAGALQADVGTIDVNSGAQDVINTNDIGDVTLTANDQIYPLFTTRNTASEQVVSVSIEITVRLS